MKKLFTVDLNFRVKMQKDTLRSVPNQGHPWYEVQYFELLSRDFYNIENKDRFSFLTPIHILFNLLPLNLTVKIIIIIQTKSEKVESTTLTKISLIEDFYYLFFNWICGRQLWFFPVKNQLIKLGEDKRIQYQKKGEMFIKEKNLYFDFYRL